MKTILTALRNPPYRVNWLTVGFSAVSWIALVVALLIGLAAGSLPWSAGVLFVVGVGTMAGPIHQVIVTRTTRHPHHENAIRLAIEYLDAEERARAQSKSDGSRSS